MASYPALTIVTHMETVLVDSVYVTKAMLEKTAASRPAQKTAWDKENAWMACVSVLMASRGKIVLS